ncbi:MAG: hypothetical protein U0805_09465 [Pirellulales bacterium]
MTSRQPWDNPLDDVEALVRAAGGYVRASDDLRPRVLEAARTQYAERRTQSCLRRVAMFVVLLAVFTTVYQPDRDVSPLSGAGQAVMADFDEWILPTTNATPRNGDADWRILDAFTKLRRQQAQLLRFEI